MLTKCRQEPSNLYSLSICIFTIVNSIIPVYPPTANCIMLFFFPHLHFSCLIAIPEDGIKEEEHDDDKDNPDERITRKCVCVGWGWRINTLGKPENVVTE